MPDSDQSVKMSETARDWPDLAGRIVEDEGGRRHVLPIRVYFEDTDFSGVVYHASYLRWCERGRSDFLRLVGNDHRALIGGAAGREPAAFVVRRMRLEYPQAGPHRRRSGSAHSRARDRRGEPYFGSGHLSGCHEAVRGGGHGRSGQHLGQAYANLRGDPVRAPKAVM